MAQADIQQRIRSAHQRAFEFVRQCRTSRTDFALTLNGATSCFTRFFGLFNLNLLDHLDEIAGDEGDFARAIATDVDRVRKNRLASGVDLRTDKAYLQLLTFSLSALAILRKIGDFSLRDDITGVLTQGKDLKQLLTQAGTFNGSPQTGNLAMFHCILLWYAKIHLGIETTPSIELWKELHTKSRNRFGFWGNFPQMTYLQFQNGYHQYEMFHFPEVYKDAGTRTAARETAKMADIRGQFAPYPGGGGCYDFDAVAILTASDEADSFKNLLLQTLDTILTSQNHDGGFCESLYVRPSTARNLFAQIAHIARHGGPGLRERIRYGITLQRPRHSKVVTHWTDTHRGWNESDLWDTWFRMMAIARIDESLRLESGISWKYIDFPGIGYHKASEHQEYVTA